MKVEVYHNGYLVKFSKDEHNEIQSKAAENMLPPRQIVEVIIKNGLIVTDGEFIKQALL